MLVPDSLRGEPCWWKGKSTWGRTGVPGRRLEVSHPHPIHTLRRKPGEQEAEPRHLGRDNSLPPWQDVCLSLGAGCATPGENHIPGAFANCLTKASGTLECGQWVPRFLFHPHIYDFIIPEVPCREKLKLCGLISVAARGPCGECNSPIRVAEPWICLVLLGKFLPLSGPSFPPIYTL